MNFIAKFAIGTAVGIATGAALIAVDRKINKLVAKAAEASKAAKTMSTLTGKDIAGIRESAQANIRKSEEAIRTSNIQGQAADQALQDAMNKLDGTN